MKYKFEAMDATGQEIRDIVEADSINEAQAKIRQLGYFVTAIKPIKHPKDNFILTPMEGDEGDTRNHMKPATILVVIAICLLLAIAVFGILAASLAPDRPAPAPVVQKPPVAQNPYRSEMDDPFGEPAARLLPPNPLKPEKAKQVIIDGHSYIHDPQCQKCKIGLPAETGKP